MATDFKIIKVLSGQTLIDIAVREYGASTALLMLFADNTDVLPYLNYQPAYGMSLRIRLAIPVLSDTNKQIAEYYERKNKGVNNGIYVGHDLPGYLSPYLGELAIPLSSYIDDDYWDEDFL